MYLFVDTMIFLHFKTLADIPWGTVVPEGDLELCIARIVVDELDKHKNTHLSGKIRERARKSLKQIEEWSLSPHTYELRRNVRVRMHFEPPKRTRESTPDLSSGDDILLAVIEEFQRLHVSDTVLLLT